MNIISLTFVPSVADTLVVLAVSIDALTILTFVSIVDVQAFALTVGVTYSSVSAWIVYLQPDTFV